MISKVRNYFSKGYLVNDLIAGVTIAALTIPTSMGYAQIAGLPPVYGLYAAIFPVVFFALFASSRQVIVGIDASSGAIAGSLIAAAGIIPNTPEAIIFIPVATFFTSLFMLLFSLTDVRRLIVYVSEPVMGGTICGIALSVAFSQLPKLGDVSASGSNSLQKAVYLFTHLNEINWLSLVLSLLALTLIIVSKKRYPKLPTPLLILIGFTAISALFNFDRYDLSLVGEIPQGLPPVVIPQLMTAPSLFLAVIGGLLTALVLTTDSLLTSLKFSEGSQKPLKEKKELFAFSLANLVSSFSGGAPINASVSRTAANQQAKGKTQVVSLVAASVISIILIFFSNFLFFMPQGVLAAIVLSAVLTVILAELKFLQRLFQNSRRESIIWLAAMITVLLSGVLLGLFLGILLSFVLIIVARMNSFSAFLGRDPETGRYIDLARNESAIKVPGVIIYRFSNALFFSNISQLIIDLDKQLKDRPETKTIIIEAYGITMIDTTAAKKLRFFMMELQQKDIQLYFVNTIGSFRDSLVKRQLDDLFPLEELLHSVEDGLNKANQTK